MNKKIYFLVFFIFANILFISSNIPLLIRYSNTPPDHVFIPKPIFDRYDYNQYLSVINQGKRGYWLYEDPFTSEKTSPGFFLGYYIFVGKIAAIFNLSPQTAFYLAKIVSTEIFFISLYLLTNILFEKKLAFISSIGSLIVTIPPLFLFSDANTIAAFAPWWFGLDSIRRLDIPPHHIFSQSLLLLTVLFYILFVKKEKFRFALFGAISIFIAGLIFTPINLPVLIAIPASVIIFVKKRINPKIIFGNLLIFLGSLFSVILAKIQMQAGHPWDLWQKWEVTMWNNNPQVDRAFFMVLSILPFLSILALPKIIKSKSQINYFILFWAFSPYLYYPFANLLEIGKVRLMMAAPFVPFILLITIFISHINTKYTKLVLIFFFVFISATSIPTTLQVFQKTLSYVNDDPLKLEIYFPNSVFAAIDFINKNIPDNSLIVTDQLMGNLLPAHTNFKTYIGHPVLTKDFPNKQQNITDFLSQKMTEDQAKNFLKQNSANYVYFGNVEKWYGKEKLSYSFLKPIYEKGGITIFKID